ncbi:thiol:disulfide interchange protein (thioredoxin) [Bacillus coahuilensis m2-6]|uniref:redoxin domain-containing protein n=1 Tax=Bacillus coahuilensis TaxID=408580 RepID=UPI000185125B|nr:redoxin domain-containing protein [Bacillus coahuilensis]KUP05683.1 thiol:disulfide interchange protein (thioredoxin) [Bacillus coahuilensis m2-6]
MRNKIILLLLVAVVGYVLWNQLNEDQLSSYDGEIVSVWSEEGDPTLSKGAVPPDFLLNTHDGESIRLSELKGKKVMLNFWATWCPPCKAEMPVMQKFYEKQAEELNVEIIAVNLTSQDHGPEALAEFLKVYDLTFPILLDESGEVGKTYQAFTIPTSYFINTKGEIEGKVIGPVNEQLLEDTIRNMD